jgi:YHS domain-containing protein
MHECPVCGEELPVDREEIIVTEHMGETYHFCSEEHREEFEESPGEYK